MARNWDWRTVKREPLWWEAAPRPTPTPAAVPARADAVIVGSGYTGLNAALTLARGGRSVVVLEKARLGEGGSSRNGGGFGLDLKMPFGALMGRLGVDRAKALYGGLKESQRFLVDLIHGEGIDCHLVESGRFIGAHTARAYESMAREVDLQRRHLGLDVETVARADQRRVIGSDIYHGGKVMNFGGHLHPALYHQGLLDRVLGAGAAVIPDCPVTAIRRQDGGFRVETPNAMIDARDVVVGTNGYTGPASPWLRRRLIPVKSQIIATETLDAALVERLFPRRRMIGDTFRLKHYYRPSPDGRRVLFGGRAADRDVDEPGTGAEHLRRRMVAIFPELADVRITHTWAGFVAFTFDYLPHIGRHEGIHYGCGYCGSGLTLASYFGHKLGLKVLGSADAATPFDDRAFPTRPFYTGQPWFLGPAMRVFALLDGAGL